MTDKAIGNPLLKDYKAARNRYYSRKCRAIKYLKEKYGRDHLDELEKRFLWFITIEQYENLCDLTRRHTDDEKEAQKKTFIHRKCRGKAYLKKFYSREEFTRDELVMMNFTSLIQYDAMKFGPSPEVECIVELFEHFIYDSDLFEKVIPLMEVTND